MAVILLLRFNLLCQFVAVGLCSSNAGSSSTSGCGSKRGSKYSSDCSSILNLASSL